MGFDVTTWTKQSEKNILFVFALIKALKIAEKIKFN